MIGIIKDIGMSISLRKAFFLSSATSANVLLNFLSSSSDFACDSLNIIFALASLELVWSIWVQMESVFSLADLS